MNEPLLRVEGLKVEFTSRRGAGRSRTQAAVNGVSLELSAGETLGLVGESGSGKSTLARALLRLLPASAGTILWRGRDFLALDAKSLRAERRHLQMIFQDALASLDPRMRIGVTLAEPLRIFEPRLKPAQVRERVHAMLQKVGLEQAVAERYPHEISGGQCQRIGIARAMMLRPAVLVCDEPVSSLDVSIQGQIVNLLLQIQGEFGVAMLFISHNLAVVRHIAQRVAVMYQGRILEMADRDAIFATPRHPYTRALIAAIPRLDGSDIESVLPLGESSAEAAMPDGCIFQARCRYAMPACGQSQPTLQISGPGQWVACHRWREI